MKSKLPPLIISPHTRPDPAPRLHPHQAPRAQHATRKAPVKAEAMEKAPPPSTEESKADGQSFRDALFGSGSSEPTAPSGLALGGFGEGGNGGQGQGGGSNQKGGERGSGRRSSSVAAAERARDKSGVGSADSAGLESGAVAEGWTELEIESRVAGRIRLSVLRERSGLRAKLLVGNPQAAQWMREHLASVEQDLAAELGCAVRLEMA